MTTARWLKGLFRREHRDVTVVAYQPRHTRLSHLMVSLATLLIALGSGWNLLASIRASDYRPMLLAGPLFVFAYDVCWTHLGMAFSRLVVCAEGIEYHLFGTSGFAFWHDMEYFGKQPSEAGTRWGILLNREVDLSENKIDHLLPMRESEKDRLKAFIPLSLFAPIRQQKKPYWKVNVRQFKRTPLGQTINHYAPRLFEYSRQRKR